MKRHVWGHRGCGGVGYPPENSLAAFRTAIQTGVDGIELDVHLSKDGEPVVIHDSTLLRTAGTEGEVADRTLAELQSLFLLDADRCRTHERIPTLKAVLDLLPFPPAGFVVNIELKGENTAGAVAMEVKRRLLAGWSNSNFLISSFSLERLSNMRALAPAARLGVLFEGDLSEESLAARLTGISELKASTVNIPFGALTANTLALIRKHGCEAVVWTPDEKNPASLSGIERETLSRRIKEEEFVVITNFPRELLQLLRPSRARATVTGVLAAYLAYGERDMLFRPTETGLETIKAPSEYPLLNQFGFVELHIKADDGVLFTVWERRNDPEKPHFVLFHGNRAHWGDTGPGAQRDRRARLKFIAKIAAAGLSITAVTLRGFGKSDAIPSEEGFLLDIKALCAHLLERGIDCRQLVVAGESLGTWAAAKTAECFTHLNHPPLLLCLQNPFTSMAEVGEQVVSHFPILQSLHLAIPASILDRHVLKNHFYTSQLINHLAPATALYIATSGKDGLVHPSHSERLAETASKKGLTVYRDIFPEAEHHTIPPAEFADKIIALTNRLVATRVV